MTPDEYQTALLERGFTYFEQREEWVGPFNIRASGLWNYDLRPFAETARVEAIAVVDEKLRAKRGGVRPHSSGGPGAGLL